jgi:hypothetical protein
MVFRSSLSNTAACRHADCVMSPGRRRGCPRRLPQIRTCPIKASGSSGHPYAAGRRNRPTPAGLTSAEVGAEAPRRGWRRRSAIRCGRVDTVRSSMPPPCCPPTGDDQTPSFPVVGSPRVRFADRLVLRGRSDFCRPSRRLLAVVGRYQRLRLRFRSPPGRRTRRGLVLGVRCNRTDLVRRRRADLPGSRGILVTVRSGLRPRWDRHARPIQRADAAPAYDNDEGSRPR